MKHAHKKDAVDPSTLTGKVMCGYQGWFTCEEDDGDLGWTHWTRDRKDRFAPGNVTVDLWPDCSELDDDELFCTGFHHCDGKEAKVFSSGKKKTVMRHFQWMQEYGIDGAFLQRFAKGLADNGHLQHKDKVLSHVREGAKENGRAYAIMYDLSGLHSGEVCCVVQNDWSMLQTRNEKHKLTDDRMYLHHKGKPVVALWGVGFGTEGREYGLEECYELIQWLKEQGNTVLLGVPVGWRKGQGDATDDPCLHKVLKAADIVSPWSVGRYATIEQATRHAENVWKPDRVWCQKHDLDFLPVVFPGFSWHNLKGKPIDSIPRLKGRFLWSQIVGAIKADCDMIYVAMFDEVDEGTAIFKCTNEPPTGNGGNFLTYEGLPSDYYLQLVGHAGKILRGEEPLTDKLPALRM